jgi:hypothetical protein
VSNSIIFGITGSFDLAMTTADKITISRFGCGAQADSEANESLDGDEEDDVVDATQSIEQNSTQSSSSDPCAGDEGAATLWAEARADDEALAAFGCLVVFANDSLRSHTFSFQPLFLVHRPLSPPGLPFASQQQPAT